MKNLSKLFYIFLLTIGLGYSQTARLQVIHNAADPAAEKVDVYLNGSILLDDFAFRTATPYIDAPAGTTINIGIAPGTSTSVSDTLKNFPLVLAENETYVAMANGVLDPASFEANPDGRSTAFTLFIKAMAREAATSDKVDFFVVHGSSDAPTVDVIARDVATLVDNAAYGDITDYISVPAGSYILDVTPGEDNNTIVATFNADLSGLSGGAAAVFASGFLSPDNDQNGAGFGIFAALPTGDVVGFEALTTARLQVIHNAADPAAANVDVYLNGGILLDDFGFRTATPYIDAPANQVINIGVAGGTSTSAADTLKNFALNLKAGETYVAMANGVLDPASFEANPDGRSTAFTLFIKAMAREAATSDKVDFFVVHGSSDAPTVDVIARDVATLVDNAAYGDITDYISVPAGSYILDVTPGEDNNTIVATFNADLSGLSGGAAAVFASGFLSPDNDQNGAGFGIFAALPTGDVVEFGIITSIETIGEAIPSKFELKQNYPNPFNPSTTINFNLVSNQKTTLKVYDISGREVAELLSDNLSAGSYSINFDASNLSSGIYFYSLQTGNIVETRRMTLVK
ncbi:MAG: DUF4397 domain-containing protein [Calditrichaeota bacterium]|nr:MAG: DUF4397 domain-containing protein [Calditrichota bacterium]MBL1206149.1 DUF4397 domain-containing protein [Calditrichota bacterium]NOG45974.1 DUF4397 domain-containing protein [Calditrichota bacterium]